MSGAPLPENSLTFELRASSAIGPRSGTPQACVSCSTETHSSSGGADAAQNSPLALCSRSALGCCLSGQPPMPPPLSLLEQPSEPARNAAASAGPPALFVKNVKKA